MKKTGVKKSIRKSKFVIEQKREKGQETRHKKHTSLQSLLPTSFENENDYKEHKNVNTNNLKNN